MFSSSISSTHTEVPHHHRVPASQSSFMFDLAKRIIDLVMDLLTEFEDPGDCSAAPCNYSPVAGLQQYLH